MRRLLPALITVIAATLVLNIFLVPGFVETRKLAASVRWSALGLANEFFRRNTGGYFDGATEEMPLLHLWSLAVEEQFYLFWPLLLAIFWRIIRAKDDLQKMIILPSLLVIASFVGACVVIARGGTSQAFYLMPYRIWELGVGAMLAFLPVGFFDGRPISLWGRIAALLGMSMIIISIFLFSPSTPFPGASALLPVLGTALIIWAGETAERNLVSRVLSHRLLVRLGVLSYGWYLWHWPLLVTARLWNLGATPSLVYRIGILILSVLIAQLSLSLIETPIRLGKFWRELAPSRMVGVGLVASSLFVVATFGLTHAQDFILSKKLGSDLVRQLRENTSLAGRCFSQEDIGSKHCTVSFPITGTEANTKAPHSAPRLAIWGDSHACSFFAMLEHYGRNQGLPVTQYCQGQTPPLAEGPFAEEMLKDLRSKAQSISPAPLSMVLASRWVSYTGKKLWPGDNPNFPTFGSENESLQRIRVGLPKTFVALKDAGVSRILLLLPYPEFTVSAIRCLQQKRTPCSISRAEMDGYRRAVIEVIQDASASFDYVRVIDPLTAVCEEEVCSQVSRGMPVVTDTNHPSVRAAQVVAEKYHSELNWLTERLPQSG